MNRRWISRGFALWGSCFVLFAGGCQADVGDFFTYAPKSHIITQDWVAETLTDGGEQDNGNRTETGNESDTEQTNPLVSQGADPGTQPSDTQTTETQSGDGQAPDSGVVGNVEYVGARERGIIRGFPFVYKGLQFNYDGNAENDFSQSDRAFGRPVASTVVSQPETAEGQKPSGENAEKSLRYGVVEFNRTFYEGKLNYHGAFQADITIAYSGAGRLQPGNGVPVEVPVEPQYSDDDDDDGWQPATVVIQLCGAAGGRNGRTYGVVRNQDGSLDMMQYSCEYVDEGGVRHYVRLIASFYGGATEEQAVGLMDRFSFKYVGEHAE